MSTRTLRDFGGGLSKKHVHMSVLLLQMWQTREECMIEENGLKKPAERDTLFDTFGSVLSLIHKESMQVHLYRRS